MIWVKLSCDLINHSSSRSFYYTIILDQSWLFSWEIFRARNLGWTYFVPRACTSDSSSASICFKKSICCSWITTQGHRRSTNWTNQSLSIYSASWYIKITTAKVLKWLHEYPTFINWKSSESSLFRHFDIRPWPLVGDIFLEFAPLVFDHGHVIDRKLIDKIN